MWAPRPARGDPSSWGSCCFETVCTLLVLSSLGIYMDIIGLGACLLFLVSVLHHWHADNRKPGWQRGLVPFFHLPPEFFLCGNIATTPGGYAGRGGGCGVWYGGGGGCWEPRRGCWAGWCGVPWGWVLGAAEGVVGGGGVGCRGGGCWEPRRGWLVGWYGAPWGWVLGAVLGAVEGVVWGAVGVGAGSRGGGTGRGGVGCRGGGCWEPWRGYWAGWWGCRGGRALGAAEGVLGMVVWGVVGAGAGSRGGGTGRGGGGAAGGGGGAGSRGGGGWWGQWGVPGEWCWELRRAKLSWSNHPPCCWWYIRDPVCMKQASRPAKKILHPRFEATVTPWW